MRTYLPEGQERTALTRNLFHRRASLPTPARHGRWAVLYVVIFATTRATDVALAWLPPACIPHSILHRTIAHKMVSLRHDMLARQCVRADGWTYTLADPADVALLGFRSIGAVINKVLKRNGFSVSHDCAQRQHVLLETRKSCTCIPEAASLAPLLQSVFKKTP